MEPLTKDISQLAIAEIVEGWRSVVESLRPDAMWISSHLPVASADDMIGTDVNAAWFFDGKEVSPRQPVDFIRFIAVQSGGFWHSGTMPPPAAVFNAGSNGGRHEIGLAHFCHLEGREDHLLIETIFGGRYGRGVLYRIEDAKLVEGAMTWIS
ncbi:hypothetical protein [Haloferula sp. BvORR071]|uniref:hypothetical protein n=1 Tax=Haloferula sp. BvORR071 TaxID=1396141 RepID=UPI00054FC7A5|nr:hypothetical protein [Haloferula sp. BvORR071]